MIEVEKKNIMHTIYTIGTQGMNDEKFLALLLDHGIDALIDIRLHNEGRRYRFASGKHIKALVESQGIAYIHETRFAPTREMLFEFRGNREWPQYERGFRRLMEERNMASIWREVAGQFKRPCLLCAEKSPEFCHRRLLAEYLSQSCGTPVVHLSMEHAT